MTISERDQTIVNKETHIRRQDDQVRDLLLQLQQLDGRLQDHLQQRDRQLDKVNKIAVRQTSGEKSALIVGLLTGAIATAIFALGLKLMEWI